MRLMRVCTPGEAHGTMSRQAQRMWIRRMWKRCRPVKKENGVHVSDMFAQAPAGLQGMHGSVKARRSAICAHLAARDWLARQAPGIC